MTMKLVIILMLVALSCASKRKEGNHKDVVKEKDFGPCPSKYKAYCMHGGTCRYLIEDKKATCICHENFEGERCQHFNFRADHTK